ncbi:hypothetical protein WG66_004164 [Moniliophthora roreri]|nr:hypothetical protein WG66_004164 [Moniliophthora roreri]
MSFTNSSHIVITGENTINHVRGNQVNGTINAGIVNFNPGRRVVKRTVNNEFRYVRRGDMITVKELSSEEIKDWEWKRIYGKVTGKHKARRTTCIVEVYPDRQSKFTALMYEGKDAEWLWKKEFKKFSRTRNPLVAQLFGINRSEIPMLIFHDELIPCAHFFNKESIWMHIYIFQLTVNMRCSERNLWMNTASVESLVPTTVDMLKDDTCIKFFANFGSSMDGRVLERAYLSYRSTYLGDVVPATAEDHQPKDSDHPDWSSATHPYPRYLWQNPPNHLPMDTIGELQFDTVYSPSTEAVARWPRGAGPLWRWWESNRMGLVEETVLDDGLTRFELVGEKVHLETLSHSWEFEKGWLAQSSRVFDAIEVAEGKEDFFSVQPPHLEIRSSRRRTASRTLHNEHSSKEIPPTLIYLFLHPLPMSVTEFVWWMDGHFYFWSFDKTGQSRMSREECERWGLPVLTVSALFEVKKCNLLELHSWSTHIYTTLRDWQKARGFDPTTSDWARDMGLPEVEILSDLGRFKEVREEEKKASSSWWESICAQKAFGKIKVKEKKASSLLEAFVRLGINAFGI